MTLLSAPFLLVFLPAVLLGFHAMRRVAPVLAVPLLALASLYFLAANSWLSLTILTASLMVNYALAGVIDRMANGRGRMLTLGILLNIAVLAWFKTHPVAGAGSGMAFMVLGMPLGLSFYAFKQITYLVDRYERRAPNLPLHRYALFLTFFPHLPSGPITPYRAFAPQLRDLETRPIGGAQLIAGMSLFVIGALKYNLFASQIGALTAPIYAAAAEQRSLCIVEGWLASYGFLLQLYFDFSAYSDMAIGLALCFGLRLSVNFDSPLKATGLGDYITRWHMSLMAFARDYFFVYLQSGLVRVLPVRAAVRRRIWSWALATVATYLLVLLWHNVSITLFVLCLVTSTLVVVAGLLRARRGRAAGAGRRPPRRPGWLRRVASNQLCLFAAASTIIFFRAENFDAALAIVRGMVTLPVSNAATGGGMAAPVCAVLTRSSPDLARLAIVALGGVVALGFPNSMRLFGLLPALPGQPRFTVGARWGAVIALAAVAALVTASGSDGARFIYERF